MPHWDKAGMLAIVSAGLSHSRVCTMGFASVLCRAVVLIALLAACERGPVDPVEYPRLMLQPSGAISTGYAHTCALTSDGTAYCWGRNLDGALGTGSYSDSPAPARVAGELRFAQISVSGAPSGSTSCALTREGQAYCWGKNNGGKVGGGARAASPVPTPIIGSHAFVQISTAPDHTCAVAASGEAYCWGENESGQLGTGDTVSSSVPVAVQGGLVWAEIRTAHWRTCGLTAEGATYCWGWDLAGSSLDYLTPVPLSDAPVFASLSHGSNHVCGLAADGAAACWGWPSVGTLGNGTFNSAFESSPQPVAGGLAFSQISAGVAHTCGIASDGAAHCWGHAGAVPATEAPDACIEYPDGTVIWCYPVPVQGSGALRFAAVAAGNAYYACGISQSGDAFCWGSGALGSGERVTSYSDVPVLVLGGLRFPTQTVP